MLGHAPLLATIAAALVVAFALGYVAQRLRLSPIVGYLVAGVVIGPFTPGIVADASIGRELSEIGVVLLMFGVGMHFSVKDLFAVRSRVLRAAGVERAASIIVATPDPLTAGVIIEKTRKLAPQIQILARGHGDADVAYLTERGADRVIVGVYEVADIMVEETLRKHA